MAKPKKTVARITIDHQPFIELYRRLKRERRQARSALVPQLDAADLLILLEHGEWFEKFSQQRRKASAARTSHGPQRKPDSEVSANALYMRKRRDAKKDRS